MIENREQLTKLLGSNAKTLCLLINHGIHSVRMVGFPELNLAKIEILYKKDSPKVIYLNVNQSNEHILKEFKQKVKEFLTRLLIEED